MWVCHPTSRWIEWTTSLKPLHIEYNVIQRGRHNEVGGNLSTSSFTAFRPSMPWPSYPPPPPAQIVIWLSSVETKTLQIGKFHFVSPLDKMLHSQRRRYNNYVNVSWRNIKLFLGWAPLFNTQEKVCTTIGSLVGSGKDWPSNCIFPDWY